MSTDKPIYHKPIYLPGDIVYVRGALLHAITGEPLAEDVRAAPRVEAIGPKGDTVASGRAQVAESTAAFAWKVPEEPTLGA